MTKICLFASAGPERVDCLMDDGPFRIDFKRPSKRWGKVEYDRLQRDATESNSVDPDTYPDPDRKLDSRETVLVESDIQSQATAIDSSGATIHVTCDLNDQADSRYDPARMSEAQRAALLAMDTDIQDINLEYRRLSELQWVKSTRGNCQRRLIERSEKPLHQRIDLERWLDCLLGHKAIAAIPVSGESRGWTMPPVINQKRDAIDGFAAQLESALHAEALEFRPVPVYRGNTVIRVET